MSLANRGKALERNILTANNYYLSAAVAEITQMPTPVRVTKVQGNKVSGYFGRSTVDFYGTIKGGRAVYFDAKETNEARFPVANETKLHPHQIEYLDRQTRLGATCFLIVDFTAERESYLLPWPIVMEYYTKAINLPARAKGKSIPLKDCQERPDIYRINTSNGYLHYLEPILNGQV